MLVHVISFYYYFHIQRLEQRLGGSYDHREDDELFVVDTGNKDKVSRRTKMDKDKLEFLVQKQCQLSFIHSNISNPNSFDVSF